jgi:hypothetical protein
MKSVPDSARISSHNCHDLIGALVAPMPGFLPVIRISRSIGRCSGQGKYQRSWTNVTVRRTDWDKRYDAFIRKSQGARLTVEYVRTVLEDVMKICCESQELRKAVTSFARWRNLRRLGKSSPNLWTERSFSKFFSTITPTLRFVCRKTGWPAFY